MKREFFKNNKGFTLIELSIVIIIVGLIAVGIIKGTGLIKSSKVISINKELTRYSSAAELFIAKYEDFPGIMKNAKTRLGDGAQESADSATNTKNSKTINAEGSPLNVESLNFFNHLATADLLDDEEYIGGTTNLASMSNITRRHYPFLKSFPDNFYYVRGDAIDNSYNEVNRFAVANKKNEDGTLDADLVFLIDTKFDDGDPLNGYISIVPTALFREWEGDNESGE